MRVLFVIGCLERGGAERQMINLAAGLADREHSVAIALLDGPGSLETEAEERGIELHRLYAGGRLPLPATLRLLRLARRWRPDVLHPYLPRDNGRATLIKPGLRGASLVWGVRSSDLNHGRSSRRARLLWRLVVWASRFADLIIANSHAGAAYHAAQGYPADRLVVIPNGIDTDRFKPDAELGLRFRNEYGIPPGVPVVGMLGRFDPMKGHDEFPEIFAQVCTQVPSAYALVVGLHTDQQGSAFMEKCRMRGVADRVVLRQQTPAPEAMLNAVDVLALPSLSEGFPNVVAEAMACGKRVVAYDVGDVRTIDHTGISTVPCLDQTSFAAAVAQALTSDPSFAHSRRESIVTRFSTESLLDHTARALALPLDTRSARCHPIAP